MFVAATILCAASSASAQSGRPAKAPAVIQLDPAAKDSADIFTGPPGTVTFRSGYMVLAPKRSVGKHSTRGYEEALIVLYGSAELRITGGSIYHLGPYTVGYCPPHTEHNVVNVGPDTLRYIWLVAKAPE
jgi:quercetin dioxygenase-like cupin family protein